MAYFQQANPWQQLAEQGRGIGDVLGRYLLELPRARAVQARQQQEMVMQQQQFGMEQQLQPGRLALQKAQIEGAQFSMERDRALMEDAAQKRMALQGFQQAYGAGIPASPEVADFSAFQTNARPMTPQEGIGTALQFGLGGADQVLPMLQGLARLQENKQMDAAKLGQIGSATDLNRARIESLLAPKTPNDTSTALLGHLVNLFKAFDPIDQPQPGDSTFPVYSTGTQALLKALAPYMGTNQPPASIAAPVPARRFRFDPQTGQLIPQ